MKKVVKTVVPLDCLVCAPVIRKSGLHGAGDSGDIAGLRAMF